MTKRKISAALALVLAAQLLTGCGSNAVTQVSTPDTQPTTGQLTLEQIQQELAIQETLAPGTDMQDSMVQHSPGVQQYASSASTSRTHPTTPTSPR